MTQEFANNKSNILVYENFPRIFNAKIIDDIIHANEHYLSIRNKLYMRTFAEFTYYNLMCNHFNEIIFSLS